MAKGNVEAMPENAMKDPSELFLGKSDGTFERVAKAAGILHFDRTRGAALTDLNLDGLLDLVEVNRREPVRLWRNVGAGTAGKPRDMGHWLAVELAQPGPDTDAIGAWIEVERGGQTTVREVTVGGGHAGGQLGPIHFGLGSADKARVRVTWPDGAGRRLDGRHGRPATAHRAGQRPAGGAARPGGMTMKTARLETIELPDFGLPSAMPELPDELYAARTERARARAVERGYDSLVVYADREHSANLSYLTGFDPRFEEAVLILAVASDEEPLILVGNECQGLATAAPLAMRVELFQDLSLPGQPRDRSRPLAEILASEGIGPGDPCRGRGLEAVRGPELAGGALVPG